VGVAMTWRSRRSWTLCAPVKGNGLNGGSPFRANVLRPEANRNCVAERRGGEQREMNCRSAEIGDRWPWIEHSVWTNRMLTRLEESRPRTVWFAKQGLFSLKLGNTETPKLGVLGAQRAKRWGLCPWRRVPAGSDSYDLALGVFEGEFFFG
jgi:hypothetical protein